MNYADLKTDIVAFFKNRSDIAASASSLIAYSEAFFNTNLRCRQMETVATLTPVSNVCTLPDDFLEFKRVVETASTRRELQYLSEAEVDAIYPSRTSGLSSHFSIIGNTLQAYPLSANGIEIVYYQMIPALSESNPTNWLLTRHPNLYLHSGLMYAAELTKDDDQFAKEALLVKQIMSDVQGLDNRSKFGNVGVTLAGIY